MHLRQEKVIFNSSLVLRFAAATVYIIAFFKIAPVSAENNGKEAAYMGVGSCSSSNCHGSVSPRNATSIVQNEYVTWEKHDAHSKAWLNLGGTDSKRIAENLGIAVPEKEPLCLSCHATYLSGSSRQGSNYHVEDGVGCESCHGAAENYLGPHTANDSTHERNVSNGMADIADLDKRLKLCASCHFGNENKYVNHRLIGAGHPRLTFELDTFSQIEPKHWVLDEDYIKRKGDYSSAKAWLTGQIEISKLTLERLKSPKLSQDGIFPELTMFNCYACHHSLTEEQWKKREYNRRPGELQLNLSSLVMVKTALKDIDNDISKKLNTGIEALHSNYKRGSVAEIASLNQDLTQATTRLEKMDLKEGLLRKMLKNLVGYAANSANTQYELAEQLAMGCSAILASLSPDGKLYKNEIDALYASLSDPRSFKLDEFISASKKFEDAL
jgi:hypothetical protein